MENNQSPSKKQIVTKREKKELRKLNNDTLAEGITCHSNGQELLLEILQKSPINRRSSQRVVVSIKPKIPLIETIYEAENNRFKKGSDKSIYRLADGDHTSLSNYSSNVPDSVKSVSCIYLHDIKTKKISDCVIESDKTLISKSVQESYAVSKCFKTNTSSEDVTLCNVRQRSPEKCYLYTEPQFTMNPPKLDVVGERSKTNSNNVDIATLIVTNTFDNTQLPSDSAINKLNKRVDNLERKLFRQELVFRSIDPGISLSSSDDESEERIMYRKTPGKRRPGCNYIEQYSHIPETSAFQRYAQQPAPLSASKTPTLEKEHNSEQYGRDFTTYDGITARGRRQCASVPCKQDVPKMAAERVHKIRHKLNPVRDYRLMDTVHYLAQGEFAPRDDGIKLTPSREAVLSDIIWEDVCRTHWPNIRLGRRLAQPERYSTRCELQRLIDSLLRERVAHVERRRRRHYRIVKLNHRHENCRPVGKTGDIIVASHKSREHNEERVHASDHNDNAVKTNRIRNEHSVRRSNRSQDYSQNAEQTSRFKHDECIPGPSYITNHVTTNREPTCCYQAFSPPKPRTTSELQQHHRTSQGKETQDLSSESSVIPYKSQTKNPRLVVKKDPSHRKYRTKGEPDLEHYILLPTLVVRTPSNMRRQKKFNELYHRILNVQLNNDENAVEAEAATQSLKPNTNKKDIGFNINVTRTDSEQNIN